MGDKVFNNAFNKSLIELNSKNTALLNSQLSTKLKIIKKIKTKR